MTHSDDSNNDDDDSGSWSSIVGSLGLGAILSVSRTHRFHEFLLSTSLTK